SCHVCGSVRLTDERDAYGVEFIPCRAKVGHPWRTRAIVWAGRCADQTAYGGASLFATPRGFEPLIPLEHCQSAQARIPTSRTILPWSAQVILIPGKVQRCPGSGALIASSW